MTLSGLGSDYYGVFWAAYSLLLKTIKEGGGDTNKGTIKAIASLLVAGSHGVLIIVLLSGNLSGDFYLISLKVGFIFFLFESPKCQIDK